MCNFSVMKFFIFQYLRLMKELKASSEVSSGNNDIGANEEDEDGEDLK